MICKDIGLINRQKRRAVNQKLRRLGLPSLVYGRPQVDAHLRKLTEYIVHINRAAMTTAITKADNLALVRYLADVQTSIDDCIELEPGEKVDHTGCFNLESKTLVDQQREMIALMAQAPGREDPLEHYMFSWGNFFEDPSPEQVDAAVLTILKVLGLEHHQTIYAAHKNTDNYHVHIAVNRVDRVTLKRTAASDGFQLNGLHQAMAIIEFEQGLTPNKDANYRADELGVVHIASGVRVRDRDGPTGRHPRHEKPDRVSDAFDVVTKTLSEGAKLHERRTNTWSFERIAIMVVAPIIRETCSFEEMHFALAEEGIGYERRGSAANAVLTMQGRAIKATIAGREMSIERLQHRYGVETFTPRPDTLEVAEPRLRTVDETRPVEAYRQAKAMHAANRAALKAELAAATAAARLAVQAQASELYALIDAHDWKGKGQLLNWARAIVAAESAAAFMAVASASHAGLKSIAGGGSFPAMPQWQPWLDLAHLDEVEPVDVAVLLSPIGVSPATPGVVPGFACRQVERECHYFDVHGRRAFRDTGSFIAVDRGTDPAAVAAVLQLAAQKWAGSSVVVVGDRQFMLLCARLAIDMDIDIENELVRKEMARLRAVRDKTRAIEAARREAAAATAAAVMSVEPQIPATTVPAPAVVHAAAERRPPAAIINDPPPVADDPPRRNLVWDPYAEHTQGMPVFEAWAVADRARAGPSVTDPLAAKIIADPDARKVYVEMLAEGVKEARRIKDQAAAFSRHQPQQGVTSHEAAPGTRLSPQGAEITTPASEPAAPIQNSTASEAARLAMLSRQFHGANWRVDDYWAPVDGRRIELPTSPRSIDEPLGQFKHRASTRTAPVMPARPRPSPAKPSMSR